MLRLIYPRSIRAQLFSLVLAFTMPAIALAVWYSIEIRQSALAAAKEHTRDLVAGTVSRLTLILEDTEAALRVLANRPRVRALDPANCDPIILEYTRLRPDFVALSVRDAKRNIVCTSLPNPIKTPTPVTFPWIDRALGSGAFSVSDAFLGPVLGRWMAVATYPVRSESGDMAGTAILSLDLDRLRQRVFLAVPDQAVVLVADSHYRVLLRSRDHGERVGKPIADRFVAQISRGQSGYFTELGLDGVRRLYTYGTVPGTDWRVMASLPENEALADYRFWVTSSLAVGIPLILLAGVLAWQMARTIVQPIQKLADVSSQVARGVTAARASLSGPTEVAEVAAQFNRMMDALEIHRLERQAVAGHYAQLLKAARDIVLLIDPDGHIIEANDAAVAAYGYSAEELQSLSLADLRSPDSMDTFNEQWEASRSLEGTLFETEHRRKDGSVFPVEVSAQAIKIDGRIYRQSFVRDITARKRAEKRIAEGEAFYRGFFNSMKEGYDYGRMIFEDGAPKDWTYLHVNAAFEQMHGVSGVENRRGSDVFPDLRSGNPELLAAYGRVASTGQSETLEVDMARTGRCFLVQVYSPTEGHFVSTWTDITERKRSGHATLHPNR